MPKSSGEPLFEDVAVQLDRLDVEAGDLLVLRTSQKLTAEKAARWSDELIAMCRAQGVRDVTVLVLDDCTNLSIERPARVETRMPHQQRRSASIVRC